ncbi:MAG: type II secretion system F family protein [Synergistales bacterium]|nr:type II secretion system F family protein [Synergistales bacterium]
MQTGYAEAASQSALVQQLEARGLIVVEAREEQQQTRRRLKPLSLEGHSFFCTSLVGYLKGGLTLLDALNLLGKQSPDKRLRTAYIGLYESVQEGRKLSAAMRELGIFRDGLVGMVESGEQSGSLVQILERAGELYHLELGLRRKVEGALTYPLIMLVVGLGVVVFLLSYVVPKLTTLFEDMGQALPLPTRILLVISDTVRAGLIPALVVLLLLFFYRKRRKGGKRRVLPFLRRLRERITISLIFSHLSTLLEAGIPLVQGLRLVAAMDPNRQRWEAIEEQVRKGYRFASALEQQGEFQEDVVYMIRVGEFGGDLEGALRRTGENNWAMAQSRMERLANLVEPAIVLFLGSVVGFVVLAVLLPIFDISSLVR